MPYCVLRVVIIPKTPSCPAVAFSIKIAYYSTANTSSKFWLNGLSIKVVQTDPGSCCMNEISKVELTGLAAKLIIPGAPNVPFCQVFAAGAICQNLRKEQWIAITSTPGPC